MDRSYVACQVLKFQEKIHISTNLQSTKIENRHSKLFVGKRPLFAGLTRNRILGLFADTHVT